MEQVRTEIDTSDWPSSFQRLLKIFFQINTHLTFLSSHSRSTIPTYDLLHKLNGDISRLDLAIIAHLLPHGDVTYEYVDENQVMLSFTEKVLFDWATGYHQSKPSTMDDAYKDATEIKNESDSKQLLIFDFKDTKVQSIGSVIKGGRRAKKRKTEPVDPGEGFFLSSKDLSLQNLTNKQLLDIIIGRNEKFKRCVAEYLKSCTEEEIYSKDDLAMKKLLDSNQEKVPMPPDLEDPIVALDKNNSTIPSDEKPSLDSMINALKLKPFYRDQIVAIETLTPAQGGKFHMLPIKQEDNEIVIHPDLKKALLNYKNISLDGGLYTHQAEALKALVFDESKNHVIVSTSTSSGKSLIYQLPIINDILWNITKGNKKRECTAFFIFPTKALAQDQKRHLQEFIKHLSITTDRQIIVDTYDGDTSGHTRSSIRTFADIIFTNPDAIHASILPNHGGSSFDRSSWHDFLSGLKYVVMDELHVYKGTFGIHVSYVMSRLMRIVTKLRENQCLYPVNNLQFISCSATIKNPISHFRAVCGISSKEKIVHISEDGSPCSEKKLIVWNPPALMNKKGQTASSGSFGKSNSLNSVLVPRENSILELAKLLLQLLNNLPTIKVIVFCPIRAVCELMMKEIRSLLSNSTFSGSSLSESDIMSYRGGYSKYDRRIIEEKMFNGKLRAIIATNALELGIDLSDLDVVITCGFPMLKLNLHQQFGRAGRGNASQGSLAIFVAGSKPLDQHYLRYPLELCDKSTYEDLCVEGLIDLGLNQLIMEMHLQCAAFEWPIDIERDIDWFSRDGSINKKNTFIKLCRERLYKDKDNKYRTSPRYLPWPVEHVAIRAVEETNYAVVDTTNGRNIVIEEVEALRTSFTLYEGGIFLHQGYPYLVKEFNSDACFAKVERVKVDWITHQRDFTDVDPIEVEYIKCLNPPLDTNSISDIPVFFGKIETTIVVFGYFKVNRRSEILEAVEVKNPPVILLSKGFWVDIPQQALNVIQEKSLSPAAGIHAAQHAIMNILPLFINGGATTNPNAKFTSNVGESELMTECKAPEKEFARRQTKRKRPARLVFYDAKGGPQGTGVAAKTFEHIDEILHTTYLRVKDCECEWGCPSCVTASFCKEMLLVMSKPAAIIILGALLGLDLAYLREEVSDGPEPNMPELNVETIQPGGSVKLSADVEILEVSQASKPLKPLIKKEEV
mmetsp:Transcript_5228/g.5916  ORF Transcript_5228/g.5916 Transcript_5228/m.5916 type:complete len:1187 (+) Transcript_5228:35-3595(+)